MSYSLKSIPHFDREVKQLAKKYKTLKEDLLELQRILTENPKAGIPIGNSCYKIRISITGKNKGKSGGARIITHVIAIDENNGTIYLLSIYDKSDQATITDKKLKELLNDIG